MDLFYTFAMTCAGSGIMPRIQFIQLNAIAEQDIQ